MKKFHACAAKNPGQRIEQIGIGLGVSAKTLERIVLTELIDEIQVTAAMQAEGYGLSVHQSGR